VLIVVGPGILAGISVVGPGILARISVVGLGILARISVVGPGILKIVIFVKRKKSLKISMRQSESVNRRRADISVVICDISENQG
jgi:Na+-transporting methylmalonyl-CoA/oxaloacetate decarboxylase beta subunit